MTYVQSKRELKWKASLCATFAIVTLALIVPSTRHHLASFHMDKDQAAFWDAFFKAVGGFVGIAGGAIALSKYFNERAKENHAALAEAQKPFAEKRQEIYFRLVTATATISNKFVGDPLRTAAEADFWLLYWGAIPMVEDAQVAAAVDAFSVALDYPERDVNLRNRSMDIARACRRSLGFAEF